MVARASTRALDDTHLLCTHLNTRDATKFNKNVKIRIIKARPRDVLGIHNVQYTTWLATYPNTKYRITRSDIIYRFKDSSSKKRRQSLAKPPKGSSTFVAKLGNKITGMCRIMVYHNYNELTAIYILPKYRGIGIDKMLWKRSAKLFNQNNKTIVHVATYNNNAIAFYKSLGFKDIGKRFRNERFVMRNGATIPEIEMVIKAGTLKYKNTGQ